MRRFALTAVIVTLALPAAAADVTATTKIVAVTVYPDRATVTREAEVELPAGASTVVVEGLPVSLFADSLRAEGEAEAAVILGAIENKVVAGRELIAPREKELNDKLQSLNDARQEVDAEIAALTARKEFLTNLGKAAVARENEKIAQVDLKPEQWSAAGTAIQNDLATAQKGILAAGIKQREIDKEIGQVQTEINQLYTGQRNSTTVRVPLEARGATKLTLKISYQLPGATWSPIYDARLEAESGKLNLIQYGEVRQQTGEAWDDVALTLSTAQPARGATPPLLSTMWVDILQMYALGGMAAERDGRRDVLSKAQSTSRVAEESFMSMDAASPAPAMAAPAPMQAAFQTATINTGGYVNEYKIAGRNTVPQDSTGKKLMIGTLDTTAKLVVQVRPQLQTNGFLVAKATLKGEAPLLPGEASLFRDGAFIGKASLPMLRPGEETDLGFGIDDQIVVKRRVLADKRGEAGVISKDTTLDRKVETSVQNLHKFAADLEVLEAVPVARNESIKLEVLKDATTPGFEKDVNDTTGLLRWKLKLEPQQKAAVGLGWHLSWPSDQQISGVF